MSSVHIYGQDEVFSHCLVFVAGSLCCFALVLVSFGLFWDMTASIKPLGVMLAFK
jgi:hypothetical protein